MTATATAVTRRCEIPVVTRCPESVYGVMRIEASAPLTEPAAALGTRRARQTVTGSLLGSWVQSAARGTAQAGRMGGGVAEGPLRMTAAASMVADSWGATLMIGAEIRAVTTAIGTGAAVSKMADGTATGGMAAIRGTRAMRALRETAHSAGASGAGRARGWLRG